MKKKKVLGLLLSFSLVLGMSLPGTLAVSVDTESEETGFSIGSEAVDKSQESDVKDEVKKENTADTSEVSAPEEKTEDAAGENMSSEVVPDEGTEATDPDAAKEEEQETPKSDEETTEETEEKPAETTEAQNSLFDRLMAAKSLEEFDKVVDAATKEELDALTDEQNKKIEEHLQTIEPAPAPAIEIEETSDETVPSEIIYPTVNFAKVAPFGDPVVGGTN